MKTFLLCVLLACGLQAAAQVSPALKSTVVAVQTPDSAVAALQKFGALLVQRGYTVDKFDKQFLTLTTTPKLVAQRDNPTLSVRVVATPGANSTLRVNGEYKATILNVPLTEPAQYTGKNGSCSTACFKELQGAALAYPAGKVSYTK